MPRRVASRAAPRAHRRNPGLWIISNPGTGPHSEKDAWTAVQRIAGTIEAESRGRGRDSAPYLRNAMQMASSRLYAIADIMFKQLRQGVHANPGVRGEKFGEQVQAVVYIHTTEGPRAHGFGNADPALEEHGRTLSMTGLKERTDVEMFALPNGTVLLKHKHGKPLWREDPD